MDTIFTKIIRKEIPSHTLLETDRHIAFLDIRPVTKGHTLVVPKKQIDYLFDLEDDLLAETIVIAKQMAAILDKVLKPIRTGVIVEGLEVPHAHIHLIPIYSESMNFSLREGAAPVGYTIEEVAEQIKKGITV
jgi:histidine triad (HIT) family protein